MTGTRDSRGGREERLLVVLGAGFSKAVSASMPLTDELGEAVRRRLGPEDQARLPRREFQDGYFEQWLSYLAEEQPHLTEDRTFEARALLHRVTREVRDVLGGSQLRALEANAAPWVMQLISVLHFSRATVINMNYDNLIECAVGTHSRPRGPDYGYEHLRVTEDDILNGVPRRADLLRQRDLAATGAAFKPKFLAAPPPVRTFRLLKPHGSLSWYSVPGDATGSTLQRWELPGSFGSPLTHDEEDRQRALPGMEPFIVPPAALKGGYLANAVVRQIGRRAHHALCEANRVVLVGHSLPLADQSFAGMLSEALGGREVPVEVVNLDAAPVRARLGRLGLLTDPGRDLTGLDSIRTWVTRETDSLAARLMAQIARIEGLTGEELVLIADTGGTEKAAGATLNGNDLVIEMATQGSQEGEPVLARELVANLGRVKRVVVRRGEGWLPVVGVAWTPPTRAQRFIHLIPIGEW